MKNRKLENTKARPPVKPCCRKGVTTIGIVVLTAFCIAFFPLAALAGKPEDELPLPARIVLRDIGALMDKEAYDQAIVRLTAFRKDSKTDVPPLIDLTLGNLYLLKDDPAQAKAPLRRAAAAMPDRVDARLNLAKACYETGEYAEAADCFAGAYELAAEAEKDPQHLYFCAVSHLLARSHGKAVAAFERLFTAHPKRVQPEWRENFVHALMADQKPRRALAVVGELVQQSTGPTRSKWQEMRLHLCLQLDMRDEARACARQLVAEDPGEARWWKALAHVELSCANYTEALAALTIYGWHQPLTDSEKKLWADLNLQLEIPQRAAPVYAELLARTADRQLLEKLICAYRQTARYEEALASLDRYAAGGDDSGLMMLRADLLYNARRFADAADAYRRAAVQDSRVAGQAWLMAGYAAWQVNDLETSRRAFVQASGFTRQKKAALAAMRQIEAVN